MTAVQSSPITSPTASQPAVGRRIAVALWTIQIVVGLFLVIASAIPKLVGQQYAVQTFDQMGAADWFRYLVGALELAGGLGLLIPALSGLAATGLVGLMIGATYTQLFILPDHVYAVTPVIIGLLVGFVAWGRRDRTRGLIRFVVRRRG